MEQEDPLLQRSIELTKEHGMASTSLLQRKLMIGYFRAERIVEAIFEKGLIEPKNGARPRRFIEDGN